MSQTDPDPVVLVCEGKCNPDIYEYDQLCVQLGAGNEHLRPYVAERARALKHTPHKPGHQFWHKNGGWQHNYKCCICGHTRRY